MLSLAFNKQDSNYNVLCLGAHSDDIEIGCGGSILKLPEVYRDITVQWVVLSADEARKREALKSANLFLKRVKRASIAVKSFRTSFFPFQGAEIKEYFEQLKADCSPDLIFTHYRHDLHQDHRLISDLTWNTFRDHLILEYEIPKYDGDLGCPNLFVPLDKSLGKRKIDYILRCFQSQRHKQWFTGGTFEALLRLRGVECAAPSKLAEAFYCRKFVLSPV